MRLRRWDVPPARGRPEAVWPTALVLFVQAALAYPTEEVERTASALLGRRGRQTDEAGGEEVNDIDLKLTGWPWADDTFSWVEPTAWACLALRAPDRASSRACGKDWSCCSTALSNEGGVNYGNRRIFGVSLEAIPGPTAAMLLALQGRPIEPRVTAAIDFLQRQAEEGADLEHLCWARLALDAYSDLPGVTESLNRLDARIRGAVAARAETPWVQPAPLRQALTALALNAGRANPFRLAGRESMESGGQPRPYWTRRRSLRRARRRSANAFAPAWRAC